MYDFVKKGYLMGLGLVNLTGEKLEEIVDELVKRGEVAEQDRRHVVDDLIERARNEQKRFRDSVREGVEKVIREMGLPGRKDYENLEKRLEELEKHKAQPQGRRTSRKPDAETPQGS